MIEELMARLLEKVESRFYGKYRAVVVDNADPENRGRLKLSIPSVLSGDVVSPWALPCAPYGGAPDQGFFFIPEVDAAVWVEFEAGLLDYPIWVGTFWAKPGGSSETPKPGDSQSPPTRKIIRTLKGHSIEMEDKDSEEVFIITYKDGSKTNVVTMDKNGIAIVDANQNKVTLDSNGAVIEDKSQNKIEMTSSAINILPAVQIKLGSAAVNPVNNLPACLFSGAPHALDLKGHATVLK
jgi:uncharacterized protein involved in type VI secretion and phage assembly